MHQHRREHHRGKHHQDRGQARVPRSSASHRSHSSASQTPLLTTSPLLFHPVPTRPALLHLLQPHSIDSANAGSTVAQFGVEHPPVPSSQADENDVWRNFVAVPDDISALNEMRSSDKLGNAAQRLVSPGVSQLGASKQLHGTYNTETSISPETRGTADETSATASRLVAKEVRPETSHQRSSETSSDDDPIAPIADEYSPSRIGSDISRPFRSPTSDNPHHEHSSKEQNVPAGSSDEVGLLVVSSSPKHAPALGGGDEATVSGMDDPADITIGPRALSPRIILPQLHGVDSASRDGPSAAVEQQLPGVRIQEDENDMWRTFVFGDSSENLEEALEEARRDTARSLRPSLQSTSTYSCEESQNGFNTSSTGHESIDRRDFAESPYDPTEEMVTIASASHVATAGASLADLSPENMLGSVETAVRTDRATQGSSSSPSAAGNKTGRRLFPNDLMTSSTCQVDTSTSTIDPKQLEKHGGPDDCFKFARPKLFVGKKIEHVDEQRQIALSEPQIRGTTQARRRQRRTTDGRANIRKLPNYGGSDPIEEFEGDCRSDRAEKGSMFGPLETENGF